MTSGVVLGWRLVGVVLGWIIGYSFFAFVGYLAADYGQKIAKPKLGLKRLLSFSALLYLRDFSVLANN